MTSQRCKVFFEGCPGTTSRHYILVGSEGERYQELYEKILRDCKSLNLDQTKELASLSWKDTDEDICYVDSEDSLEAAVSYIIPDQAGFSVLRLSAKFRPKSFVPATINLPAKTSTSRIIPMLSNNHVDDNGDSYATSAGVPLDYRRVSVKPHPLILEDHKKNVANKNKLPILAVDATEGDFPCPHCIRTFTQKGSLTRHLKGHSTGMPSSLCEKCGTMCLTMGSFLTHDCVRAVKKRLRQQKRMKNQKNVAARIYNVPAQESASTQCEKCGTRCKSVKNLHKHNCQKAAEHRISERERYRTANLHRTRKRTCEICKEVLNSHAAMTEHMNEYHQSASKKASANMDASVNEEEPFVCVHPCERSIRGYLHPEDLARHRRSCQFVISSNGKPSGSSYVSPSRSALTFDEQSMEDDYETVDSQDMFDDGEDIQEEELDASDEDDSRLKEWPPKLQLLHTMPKYKLGSHFKHPPVSTM